MKVKWRPIIRAGIGPHCFPLQYTDVVLPEVERVEHYAHVNLVSGYLRGFAVGRQRGFEAGQRAALAAYLCGVVAGREAPSLQRDDDGSPTTRRGDRQP